jgi:putative ABC transport system substrate-binding protein
LIPQAKLVALLVNAGNSESRTIIKDTQGAATSIGIRLVLLDARTEGDIDVAFKTAAQEHVGALIAGTDPLFYIHRDRLIALAARDALPTVYFLRDFVASGGLMSYGSSFLDSYREAGVYVGRIIKAEKAGDLPVIAINSKTARALGLTIPPGVLAIADEVIE